MKIVRVSIFLGMMLMLCVAGCEKRDKQTTPAVTPKIVQMDDGVSMVAIPAGDFMMGSAAGADDEQPQHKVLLDGFYMDQCEVSQGYYIKVMGTNPSRFGGKDWEAFPVDRISWEKAAFFCNERSRKEGLTPCYNEESWACDYSANGYRLPTEAEWEYAARAGSDKESLFAGKAASEQDDFVWFKGNSHEQTRPVKAGQPNGWGLYGVAGNVYEWCNDYYGEDYYRHSAEKNPVGPEKGETRVLRGGCWVTSLESCRWTSRFNDDPVSADSCLGCPAYGFRCVRCL